jgi:hypothetical protein
MITWITYWYDFDKEESIDRIEEAAVKFVLQGLNSGNMEIPGLKK